MTTAHLARETANNVMKRLRWALLPVVCCAAMLGAPEVVWGGIRRNVEPPPGCGAAEAVSVSDCLRCHIVPEYNPAAYEALPQAALRMSAAATETEKLQTWEIVTDPSDPLIFRVHWIINGYVMNLRLFRRDKEGATWTDWTDIYNGWPWGRENWERFFPGLSLPPLLKASDDIQIKANMIYCGDGSPSCIGNWVYEESSILVVPPAPGGLTVEVLENNDWDPDNNPARWSQATNLDPYGVDPTCPNEYTNIRYVIPGPKDIVVVRIEDIHDPANPVLVFQDEDAQVKDGFFQWDGKKKIPNQTSRPQAPPGLYKVNVSVNGGPYQGSPKIHLWGVDKLTITDRNLATNKKEDTTEDDATPTDNTLVAGQDATGKAIIDLELTWQPTAVTRTDLGSKLLWKIENKAGEAAQNWSATSGDFSATATSATWTCPATGMPNREFKILAWYDKNGNGSLDTDESRRLLYATVLKVDIKDENGIDDPPEFMSVDSSHKYKVVVTPSVPIQDIHWSSPSDKISLVDGTSDTVNVIAGSLPTDDGIGVAALTGGLLSVPLRSAESSTNSSGMMAPTLATGAGVLGEDLLVAVTPVGAAPISRQVKVKVVKVEIGRVFSDQLPNRECNNRLPGQNLMYMGTRADDRGYLQVEATALPQQINNLGLVGVRNGNTALGNGSIQPSRTPLDFAPNGSRQQYEVIGGVDQNGDSQLQNKEIFTNFSSRILILTRSDYTYSYDKLNTYATITWGVGSQLLEAFIDGVVPPYVVDTPTTITSVELTHPLGADWDISCSATTRRYTYAEGTEASDDVEEDQHTIDALRASLNQHKTEVQNYFTQNPTVTEHPFESWNWQANNLEFDDLALHFAFGHVTIFGTVSVTVRRSDLKVTHIVYGGSFDDIYDFNYNGAYPSEHGATIQVGFPTRGTGGRVFRDRVEFSREPSGFDYDFN